MGIEQLYFLVGFLLGVLLTGCLFIAGLIIYYEWLEESKKN
jgi:hypothetical protein